VPKKQYTEKKHKMAQTKISIGSDHAGFPFKEPLKKALADAGYEVLDFGTNSLSSVDYPDFAHPTALAVETQTALFGILICGSGNGVAMTANKHPNVRCALCWNTELAELSRAHNNANMLAIPARFVTLETAEAMLKTFLQTPFEGGRHAARVEKISC
jgi:ribose 5-phosphate isomerase B